MITSNVNVRKKAMLLLALLEQMDFIMSYHLAF
jgi:hypothetical protein